MAQVWGLPQAVGPGLPFQSANFWRLCAGISSVQRATLRLKISSLLQESSPKARATAHDLDDSVPRADRRMRWTGMDAARHSRRVRVRPFARGTFAGENAPLRLTSEITAGGDAYVQFPGAALSHVRNQSTSATDGDCERSRAHSISSNFSRRLTPVECGVPSSSRTPRKGHVLRGSRRARE